jgi:hypothetical protein
MAGEAATLSSRFLCLFRRSKEGDFQLGLSLPLFSLSTFFDLPGIFLMWSVKNHEFVRRNVLFVFPGVLVVWESNNWWLSMAGNFTKHQIFQNWCAGITTFASIKDYNSYKNKKIPERLQDHARRYGRFYQYAPSNTPS